jgi:hypothetical protein
MMPIPKPTTSLSSRSRLAAVIAFVCFVAITGCGEPTGPRTLCCAPKPEQTVNGLAVLSDELHDAADVFVGNVSDIYLRAQAELAINRLADQFIAGKVAGSRASIADARLLIARQKDVSALELTPAGLALDYIERRMNEILNSGA